MQYIVKIQNLKCGGCAYTIQTKISELKGVSDVTVEVDNDEVIFNCDSDSLVMEVKQKLKTLGYPEETEANTIVTKAKSYVSCATGKLSNHEK
ncbi:heavy-metal-associated domain-containing protein [Hanstruepera marina]|uniref:heavy-metal-associated domain-containing protein n=1 Tax=Hanstruepera marina TaxID=2873265 RepID=UPI001CA6882A|nr:heavy-metal-associated domain-containing protein [Hanstruepera marina]